jgi:hypothetical protein
MTAVGVGRELAFPADSVEKLDSQGCASHVEMIDLSDRVRIDDRDHGKGESTPEEVLRTECIEFFNRIGQYLALATGGLLASHLGMIAPWATRMYTPDGRHPAVGTRGCGRSTTIVQSPNWA